MVRPLQLAYAGSVISNFRAAFLRCHKCECTLADQEILDIYNSDDTKNDLLDNEVEEWIIAGMTSEYLQESIHDRWAIYDMYQAQKLKEQE